LYGKGNENHESWLSKVQCSHIVTFMNLLGHFLMERHNRIDHILILDIRSFRGMDCHTDHHPLMRKVRKRVTNCTNFIWIGSISRNWMR
jgi:hypothetical protein